jgi:hypothetical protein
MVGEVEACRITDIIAIAIGAIIAAVAAFDTHMEMNPDEIMTPATIAPFVVPTMLSVVKAMRLSSPQRWMPAASKNPPKKRKMISEA